MPPVSVLMYTSAVCPYCSRAEALLKHKGVETIQKRRIDTDDGLREEMMNRTGRRTVPQIFIGNFHVGGCDDLYALEHAGKLESLLRGEIP